MVRNLKVIGKTSVEISFFYTEEVMRAVRYHLLCVADDAAVTSTSLGGQIETFSCKLMVIN